MLRALCYETCHLLLFLPPVGRSQISLLANDTAVGYLAHKRTVTAGHLLEVEPLVTPADIPKDFRACVFEVVPQLKYIK